MTAHVLEGCLEYGAEDQDCACRHRVIARCTMAFGRQIRSSWRARAIAAVRLVTPSFRYTLATWLFAVLRDT